MPPADNVELYQDAAKEWRWRRVAKNGRIVAESGEGYTRKSDGLEAAQRENPGADVVIHESFLS